MHIAINNGLPEISMRFGTSNDNEINLYVGVDSCAGLNIGNLRVHQWGATTYPHIVKSWVDFDDKDKFEPLGLNCAVEDVNDSTSNKGKLNASSLSYPL